MEIEILNIKKGGVFGTLGSIEPTFCSVRDFCKLIEKVNKQLPHETMCFLEHGKDRDDEDEEKSRT